MARDVTGQLPPFAVPPAIWLGLGFQSCPLPQECKHSIGLKVQQIVGVQVLCSFQRARQKPNGIERKRPHLDELGSHLLRWIQALANSQ